MPEIPPEIPPEQSLIEYPSAFPIKVMGPQAEGFVEAIVEVARRFDPTFDDARVISGSSARSAEAARSRTRSCEPMATIVRKISSMPRSSSISTCSPG